MKWVFVLSRDSPSIIVLRILHLVVLELSWSYLIHEYCVFGYLRKVFLEIKASVYWYNYWGIQLDALASKVQILPDWTSDLYYLHEEIFSIWWVRDVVQHEWSKRTGMNREKERMELKHVCYWIERKCHQVRSLSISLLLKLNERVVNRSHSMFLLQKFSSYLIKRKVPVSIEKWLTRPTVVRKRCIFFWNFEVSWRTCHQASSSRMTVSLILSESEVRVGRRHNALYRVVSWVYQWLPVAQQYDTNLLNIILILNLFMLWVDQIPAELPPIGLIYSGGAELRRSPILSWILTVDQWMHGKQIRVRTRRQ